MGNFGSVTLESIPSLTSTVSWKIYYTATRNHNASTHTNPNGTLDENECVLERYSPPVISLKEKMFGIQRLIRRLCRLYLLRRSPHLYVERCAPSVSPTPCPRCSSPLCLYPKHTHTHTHSPRSLHQFITLFLRKSLLLLQQSMRESMNSCRLIHWRTVHLHVQGSLSSLFLSPPRMVPWNVKRTTLNSSSRHFGSNWQKLWADESKLKGMDTRRIPSTFTHTTHHLFSFANEPLASITRSRRYAAFNLSLFSMKTYRIQQQITNQIPALAPGLKTNITSCLLPGAKFDDSDTPFGGWRTIKKDSQCHRIQVSLILTTRHISAAQYSDWIPTGA